MSARQCAIDNILYKIKQDFIHIGKNSAKELKETVILLPVGGLNNENKALKDKNQTYKWGQRIQKEVNKYYKSHLYGNVIELDNASDPRGTLVRISIYSRLVDAHIGNGTNLSNKTDEEVELTSYINHRFLKYFGEETTVKSLEILNKIKDTKHPLSYLSEKLIKYAEKNNVDVILEDVDGFKLQGNDYESTAYYDIEDNKIYIAGRLNYNNSEIIDLLLHEIIHSISYSQLNTNNKTTADFNKLYEHAKKNITDPKFEYALSNVDEFMTHLFTDKEFSKVLGTIKPTNISRYKNLFQEIFDFIVKLLNISSENKTLYEQAYTVASNIFEIDNSENPLEFGEKTLSAKKESSEERKVSNVIESNIKQKIYFKRLIKKFEKRKSIVQKELKTKKYSDELNSELVDLNQIILNLQSGLAEYKDTGNKQVLANLANDVLDKMDDRVDLWENMINNPDVDDLKIDDLEETIETIKIFMELPSVAQRAMALYERINPKYDENNPKKSILTTYILKVINKSTGKELTEEDINYDSKDIFIGESNFGTLSDIPNYLGKTIGYLIKEAQSKISIDNRKSYEEVKKHVDILKEYNNRNGISSDKAYDIFIQEHTGKNGSKTTILTKEYTPEFYKEMSKAKSMGDNALNYKKSIATWNPEKTRWEPKDKKYLNQNYIKIQKTPELKQFYDFWQKKMAEIFEILPIAKDVNFIPNVVEQSLIDIIKSDKSVADKFKESINSITQVYDANQNPDSFISDENLLKDEIPLKYIGDISNDIKSKNLDNSLLKFLQFANNYKHMSEVLPKTRLFQEEIASRMYMSNVNSEIRISGKESNIYKMTEDFINMQVKGKMKKDQKLGKFNYGGYIDFGLKYTSLLRIGFNPFNAITNVLVGSIGNIIESIGGRYFTTSEFLKAQNTFFSQVWNDDSKVNALIRLINPLMELEDYENLNDIKIGSKDYLDKVKDIMYSPQRLGEKMMQTSTMIANLMHDKITTKDGKSISLWEAFDETGKWNTELIGYELTDDMVFKMTNKIQRINQMIHGRYSAKDAAAISQNALFRAAFQFKKWIPAAFEARLQSKRFDDRLGYYTEGRYITLKNVVLKNIFTNPYTALEGLIGPLIAKKKLLEEGKLTELEIYNMRKNMAELVLILASYLAFIGFGDDEERKTNGFYKFAMNQLDRISGDLLFFYNPKAMNQQLIGVPLTKTISDIIVTIQAVPYAFGAENVWYLTDKEYQSGPRKGENKFLAKTLDIIPVVKPITDVVRMTKDDVSYQPMK